MPAIDEGNEAEGFISASRRWRNDTSAPPAGKWSGCWNPGVRPPERSLLQELESWPGVRLAVLFGSAARGESGRDSDLDVGVLFEQAPHAWADFRARAMIDWWDWAPTARLLNAAAASRLRAALADGSP